MPSKKICRCGKLIELTEVMCLDCTKRREEKNKLFEKQRGTSTKRGYDYKWQKYRIRFLRNNPLCIKCLEECNTRPATIVDHIEPHKGNTKLFWDPKNHQGLCKRHHDIKTAAEDGGFNNKIK